MNMFKKNGGFTLVELIVVIAILAILAGVAVPAYSGYISRANDAAVITALDAVQTAAQAANATGGAINAITVGTDGTTVTVTAGTIANDFKANFEMFYTSSSVTSAANGSASITIPVINNFENSSYKNGANWYATDALATAANANYKAGWNAVG